MLNLYQVLNVDVTASQSEIISASEKLIAEWDLSKIEDRKSRAIAAGVLREILDARDVLANPRTRKEYDVSIGLAHVVYKTRSGKSQNADKDASEGLPDSTTQGYLSTTERQEVESDPEEFHDSHTNLIPDDGTAALGVNQKEARSSHSYVKGSDDNINGRKLSQSERKNNGITSEKLKLDDTNGKANGSLENMNGIPKQSKPELENSNATAQTSQMSNIVNDSHKENKFINVVNVSKLMSKDTPSNKNGDKVSESSKLNFNSEDSTSVTKLQNSNDTKYGESKTLDYILEQEQGEKVVNEQDDGKFVADSSKTNVNENQFSKSVEIPQHGTENKALVYLNKDAIPKSLSTDLSQQENNLLLETKNGSNSKQTSNANVSQNLKGVNKVSSNTTTEQNSENQKDAMELANESTSSAELLNKELYSIDRKSPGNQKDFNIQNNINGQESQKSNASNKISSNNKLSGNSVLSPDGRSRSMGNINNGIVPSVNGHHTNSKKETKTKDNKSSFENQNASNFGETSETTPSKNFKSSNEISPDEKLINPKQSKIGLHEHEIPPDSQNGSNIEISNDGLNGSGLQESSMTPTKPGDQSRSVESSIKDVLSQILSKIGLNSEMKKVSTENLSGLNSEAVIEGKSSSEFDGLNIQSPDVNPVENQNLKTANESKSETFIQPSTDNQTKTANGISKENFKMVEQSNIDAPKTGNISYTPKNEFSSTRTGDSEISNGETEIFSSETVWKRSEPPKTAKETPASKKPSSNPLKSVSASTRTRGSETKTVYFFGPEGERVQVYVDGQLRVQVSRGGEENSYTSDWTNSESPAPLKKLRASTTIQANDAKIRTARICDGKQETISVHKDHVLLCKISTSQAK